MKYPTLRIWMQGTLVLALAACGGGGGDDSTGGTSSPDVSIGTITAFGSVWVNGVEFKTSAATAIKIDDNPHPESDLRVGMVARIEGSIAGATASAISVDSKLKGRVESVSGGTQMVVMGQTVLIDGTTRFENGVRPVVGDYVELHGLVQAGGQILATFVERKTTPADPPFVVHGIVGGHMAGGTTFTIGGLTVNAPGAMMSNMPAGSSWNGLHVRVKGGTCAGTPPAAPCGAMTASRVEHDGMHDNVAKVEVEGFITSFVSAASFTVGSQPVVTTAATVFEGGLAGQIALGVRLEVEGSISGGVLTARKVSFED